MNQDEIAKAYTQGTEFEYLFEDGQWTPACIKEYQPFSFPSPTLIIQLLRCPHSHSGIIHLNDSDIKHHLRLKSSN